MWLLQRPGNNADLPKPVVWIHGMRGKVCGRCEPPLDVRRDFPELTLDRGAGLRPECFHDPPVLIEDRAIALIRCRTVRFSRGNPEVLTKGADPPRRVATREPCEDPPACQVVEHGDILRQLHRIDCRQIHPELT